MNDRPVILACPLPRTLPLLFAPDLLHQLYDRYDVVETTDEALPSLPDETLREARYIIGQPPLTEDLLARMESLRCIFNVESNLLPNMPYEEVFRRGIHVVIPNAVFAEPVAEIGLGFALALARNIHGADADFRRGEERWGGEATRAHGSSPVRPSASSAWGRWGRPWPACSRASALASSPTTPGRRHRSPARSAPSLWTSTRCSPSPRRSSSRPR